MDLSTIKNTANWGTSAANLNENFSKIKVEIEKLKYISGSTFIGIYDSSDNLPPQTSAVWAFVGDLDSAKPYAYYVAGNVPSGYSAGWNDLSGALGTYDFTSLETLGNSLSLKICDPFIVKMNGPITFSVSGNTATAKVHDAFLILSSNGTTPYVTIPAQEIEVPKDYGCILAVYDRTKNQISTTLTGVPINSVGTLDGSKIYIPVFAWSYLRDNETHPFSNGEYGIFNYHPDWHTYTSTLAGGTALYGAYMPIKCRISGIYCKINAVDADVVAYLLNLKTNECKAVKTFSKSGLSVGIMYLGFDSPVVAGEDEQLMVGGKIGYKSEADKNYKVKTLNYYINQTSGVIPAYNTLQIAVAYKLADKMNTSDLVLKLPSSHDADYVYKSGTVRNIGRYVTALNNVGYVGRYIPAAGTVKSLTLNVRATGEAIDIALVDLNSQVLTSIKTFQPDTVGVVEVEFDTPVEIDYSRQIVVHGKIGYLYSADMKKFKSGNNLTYNYSGNGELQMNPIALTDFAVEYNFSTPIPYKDYVNESIYDIFYQLYTSGKNQGVSEETVSISDYGGNLRNVFSSILPSQSKHYTVLIPEGTYDVDSWFTDEEKAVESDSFRGLVLPDYVKLLGVGAREKIILRWINTSGTHRGYISTLNTHHWHELENLTVIGEDIRYAVHDDIWDGLPRYLRVTNCDFQVTDCSRAWGAGHNGGYDGEFVDCKFSVSKKRGNMDSMTYIEPFGLHDNTYSQDDSKVSLVNCRFYNVYTDHPCVNFGMSQSTGISHARIIGCKMNTNVFLGASSEGIINCRVTGYGNVMGSSPEISENAVESINTLIDLI